jgi:hypothetical protein
MSGQMPFYDVDNTTTFVLQVNHRDLASAIVTVNGDPGFIKVSPGAQVTADDITQFNQQWMQPWEIKAALDFARSTLSNMDSSGTTGNGERMAAMVRMYDLTHDPRYLDHLFDLVELMLRYRDDRASGDGPKVKDEIRDKVGLPAWGGGLLDNFGLHSVLEWTSSLYAYPIAAFARILAEDPALRARYTCNVIIIPGAQAITGAQGAITGPQVASGLHAAIPQPQTSAELQAVAGRGAAPGPHAAASGPEAVYIPPTYIPRCADPIVYTNRVLETVDVFFPQLQQHLVGDSFEATLTHPKEYKSRPTKEDCDNALDDAKKHPPYDIDRLKQEHSDCLADRDSAEKPLPHNLNLAFSSVLIELSRVLATPFYQQSPARAPNAEQVLSFISGLMPRQQRYFVDHLNPESLKDDYDACKSHFCWYYEEPFPRVCPVEFGRPLCPCQTGGYKCLPYHVEDTDHGSMDMTYVGPFLRDFARLNAAAESVHERFSLGSEQLQGFARAFTETIAPNTDVTGGNFAYDLGGRQKDPPDGSDSLCDGWLELTRVDTKVWRLCREMSLRIVNDDQPYLRIGNHSVLLETKQFLP